MKISFLGGGPIALSIGFLAQEQGHEITLGLRNPKKEIPASFKRVSFADAATSADIVVIAIPYYVLDDVLPSLADALSGKIVIDATNPVGTDWQPIPTGEQSSGAETIAKLLPKAKVVKAFNSIFADALQPERLNRAGQSITFFAASDEPDAKKIVLEFGRQIGLNPLDAGPLKSARYLEAMAHLHIELAVGQKGGTNAAYLYHRP